MPCYPNLLRFFFNLFRLGKQGDACRPVRMFEYLVRRGSQTSSALSLWSVRESWQKYTTHMSCGGLRCTAPHNGLFLHRRKNRREPSPLARSLHCRNNGSRKRGTWHELCSRRWQNRWWQRPDEGHCASAGLIT